MIDDGRIAEIRARLDAATAGPWSRFVDEWRPTTRLSVHRIGAGDEDIANVYLTRPADADLISHAPADLADLLAEVERLRVVVDAAVAEDEAFGSAADYETAHRAYVTAVREWRADQ